MSTQAVSQAAPAALTIAERIKELLGQGLPTNVVASAVGCEASYVSQLMEQEDFRNAVLISRAGKAEGAVKRDNKWDEIEAAALERAGSLVNLVSRPGDLIRIAAMANAAKRRATEFANGSETASVVVNLTLPQAAVIHFQMNSQAQVVEVDGRSMAPLPSKNLHQRLQERTADRITAGVVDVKIPELGAPIAVSLEKQTERKRVVSILEQIGFADEAVPVPNIMNLQHES